MIFVTPLVAQMTLRPFSVILKMNPRDIISDRDGETNTAPPSSDLLWMVLVITR